MEATKNKLPDEIQNEIWMIMYKVSELGAYPQDIKSSHGNWGFECETEFDVEVVDGSIEIDCCPSGQQDRCTEAAQKLKETGDAYNAEAGKVQEQLVLDIMLHIRAKGDEINASCLASGLSFMRPSDVIFQSGVMGNIYGYFKSRLENYLGDEESFSNIALVSSITMGIAHGLRECSSQSVHVATSLATKFISDKYGQFLVQNGGMAKLVLDSQVD